MKDLTALLPTINYYSELIFNYTEQIMDAIYKFSSISFLFIIIMVSCSGADMEQKKIIYKNLDAVTDKTWENISKQNIFFGHQSVGNNIIAGLEDIIEENPNITLNIVALDKYSQSSSGFFIHESNLGKNDYPETKIQAFKNILEDELGEQIDIAFMKFCFVDVESKTNINEVFHDYKENIERLNKEFPKIKFVHFTIPLLRASQNVGFKAWVKKLLGKSDAFFANEHNVARNKLNDLIRNEYNGKEPVFDIAEIESTFPDGTRCFFEKDGKAYFALVPEYTQDGGHLNKIGRKKVAEQLLLLLANLQ